MLSTVQLDAPAKINLHLRVGPPRPDGFHSIASIFQAISLADRIRVSIDSSQTGIELHCNADCAPQDNTMYRAASLFLDAARANGVSPSGIRIDAEKLIPAGGGLGGGSSDAAAVLKALDMLFPATVPAGRLLELALRVGSDVPFFLGSPCQAVRGRGEILNPMDARDDYSLVLAHPGVSVATKDAYRALDAARSAVDSSAYSVSTRSYADERWLDEDIQTAMDAYRKQEPGAWQFCNDFFGPVSAMQLKIAQLYAHMGTLDADFLSMSGSGSVLYAIYHDEDKAIRALEALKHGGIQAWLAFPLARFPKPV
ncbi:MAG TPA: 4-(cytidine 5'-diphospho)-2-C-methyl-D-erythritol kinase [Spirochaetales bacterium]|nr:4-(cytidine 5'-diphospho)-2-C-methyl-D-erythritol kinase [Spirochaetales bacterium]